MPMQVLIAILVWALAPSRQRAEESRCMAQEPKHIMEDTTSKEEHATATRSALIHLIHTSLAVIAGVSTGYLFVGCGYSLRGSKRHGQSTGATNLQKHTKTRCQCCQIVDGVFPASDLSKTLPGYITEYSSSLHLSFLNVQVIFDFPWLCLSLDMPEGVDLLQ